MTDGLLSSIVVESVISLPLYYVSIKSLKGNFLVSSIIFWSLEEVMNLHVVLILYMFELNSC